MGEHQSQSELSDTPPTSTEGPLGPQAETASRRGPKPSYSATPDPTHNKDAKKRHVSLRLIHLLKRAAAVIATIGSLAGGAVTIKSIVNSGEHELGLDGSRVTIRAGGRALLSLDTLVRRAGDLRFTPQVHARPDEVLQYVVTLRNIGQGDATNVVLRDATPPRTILLSDSFYERDSGLPLRTSDLNFVGGGYSIPRFGPSAWIQIYFSLRVIGKQPNGYWFKNYALFKSDQTQGREYFAFARADF